MSDFLRVLTLQDYNTRVVLLGTTLLGVAGGVVGVFMLLRKRSLVGDVVGHAALPGVAIAFLVMEMVTPGSGKSLPGLLIGAAATGLLGVLCALSIRKLTRIKEDAALAIVLSIFFGVGVALLSVIQNLPTGSQAGLDDFIFAKTAGMVADDVKLIAVACAIVLLLCGFLMKEFAVLCFDEDYAASQGWPVGWLDLALMALVVGVTVVGLQSVGLILVVAILIIPAAAARFWTDDLFRMICIAATVGGGSAFVGSAASAVVPRLAAGPMIVVTGAACFLLSMFFGARRGVLLRWWELLQLRRRVGRHDLMRAAYEWLESQPEKELTQAIPRDALLSMRSWSARRLTTLLARCRRQGLMESLPGNHWKLTERGVKKARRAARNHRLWELYLINYADIAPSHVDRDADQIEHVLAPDIIQELEAKLGSASPDMPGSPHPVG